MLRRKDVPRHLELDTGITRFYRTDLYVLPPPIQMLGRRKLHLTPLRCDANTKIRVLKIFSLSLSGMLARDAAYGTE